MVVRTYCIRINNIEKQWYLYKFGLWISAAYLDQIIVRVLFSTTVKCKKKTETKRYTEACSIVLSEHAME